MVQLLLLLHDHFLDQVLDSTKTPDSSQTSLAPASSWPLESFCSVLRWLACLQRLLLPLHDVEDLLSCNSTCAACRILPGLLLLVQLSATV